MWAWLGVWRHSLDHGSPQSSQHALDGCCYSIERQLLNLLTDYAMTFVVDSCLAVDLVWYSSHDSILQPLIGSNWKDSCRWAQPSNSYQHAFVPTHFTSAPIWRFTVYLNWFCYLIAWENDGSGSDPNISVLSRFWPIAEWFLSWQSRHSSSNLVKLPLRRVPCLPGRISRSC